MAVTITTRKLVRELDELPAQQAVAMRVLQVSGDQRSSASDLAAALMADPAMTAQVMRLANSAYYGLSGRVGSVPFAVTVIGFVSIRSVVAAFAAGALGKEAVVPPGFWERAAATAAAASLVAPRVNAPRSDSFSMGLLHELGDFLLFRNSPEAHAEVHGAADQWDCKRRARVEKALYGTDHGESLARCLEAWFFPDEMVQGVADHIDATKASVPLARCLTGAVTLGTLAEFHDEERRAAMDAAGKMTKRFQVVDIEPVSAWALSRQARHDATSLFASLTAE